MGTEQELPLAKAPVRYEIEQTERRYPKGRPEAHPTRWPCGRWLMMMMVVPLFGLTEKSCETASFGLWDCF